MPRRYTYAASLSWGGDIPTAELEVEVSYEVSPGCDASLSGPAEDPEIQNIRLEKVGGKPRPWGMYDGYVPNEDDAFEEDVVSKLEGSARHLESMIEEAAEQHAADLDARDEADWERRTEARA